MKNFGPDYFNQLPFGSFKVGESSAECDDKDPGASDGQAQMLCQLARIEQLLAIQLSVQMKQTEQQEHQVR